VAALSLATCAYVLDTTPHPAPAAVEFATLQHPFAGASLAV
jgi:hypothetical protein